MESASDLYRDYATVADNLERRLVAMYGQQKAERLFQRMAQSRFERICHAAANDALKRQWVGRLRERISSQVLEAEDAA